jgi:hypothetical protein
MKPEQAQSDIEAVKHIAKIAANDKKLIKQRVALAHFSSETFLSVGIRLHLLGHIVGPDRTNQTSPFGHGSDETVAISVLLRIASQLISASTDLFEDGRTYAAAALLRQMVEIEYLAWAMETRDRDGERWLRSNQKQRENFFKPAKLRKAAQGKFRGKDYGYHCELGGHPVPGASILLGDDLAIGQLLLADLLGHAGRIWNHLVGWARKSSSNEIVLSRAREMSKRFADWTSKDPFFNLPPPP